MSHFAIHAVNVGNGLLALSPLPGRAGGYVRDFSVLREWQPQLVISMTTGAEMQQAGASRLGDDLRDAGIQWAHLPVADFGTPPSDIQAVWPEVSTAAKEVLAGAGRVLVHCRGGCGRSGMVVLRLMVELGELPDAALKRLRAVRPCAVETEGQMEWAVQAHRATPEG